MARTPDNFPHSFPNARSTASHIPFRCVQQIDDGIQQISKFITVSPPNKNDAESRKLAHGKIKLPSFLHALTACGLFELVGLSVFQSEVVGPAKTR